eukprot:15344733-Ditylum_brightwellii.AAC.1
MDKGNGRLQRANKSDAKEVGYAPGLVQDQVDIRMLAKKHTLIARKPNLLQWQEGGAQDVYALCLPKLGIEMLVVLQNPRHDCLQVDINPVPRKLVSASPIVEIRLLNQTSSSDGIWPLVLKNVMMLGTE